MVLSSVVRPSHALRVPWRSCNERLEFPKHRFLFAKIDLPGVAKSHTRSQQFMRLVLALLTRAMQAKPKNHLPKKHGLSAIVFGGTASVAPKKLFLLIASDPVTVTVKPAAISWLALVDRGRACGPGCCADALAVLVLAHIDDLKNAVVA